MKKVILMLLILTFGFTLLVGCSKEKTNQNDSKETKTEETKDTEEKKDDKTEEVKEQVLKVAAFEGGYGADMWHEVVKAFEASHKGVTVELTIDKKIEDVISPSMKAGEYPDVVHLATGREAALTETIAKEKGILPLTDVLEMTVPGESVKVKDKIIGGFTETLATNPYGDGVTYYAPMFYSPCGLFYNAGLLEEKGWTVPTTWEEMWELGDKAAAEGIALFTYPTTGYFDAFFYALISSIGGADTFNAAMTYEDGIWESPEAAKAFEIVGKLAKYTEKTTVANANNENFTKNQQLILDNKAIFVPNGTWLPGEMAEAPRAEGFKWGFTALPAVEKGGSGYSFTWFEQLWIPAAAKNQELAKEFVAYMYSDEVVKIFAKSNAIQPVPGVSEYLEGDNKMFYSIYDNGAKAAMGGFVATTPVEGVSMADTLFGTVNSIVSGDKTVAQWQASVEEVSDKLRAAME
jgi:N-acetylglucosamine transport system substrate-binding protein